MCSEIARLRQQIQEEYEAATRGLTGYAITSRHSFITARMENIAHCHSKLLELVGPEEAIQIIASTAERVVK